MEYAIEAIKVPSALLAAPCAVQGSSKAALPRRKPGGFFPLVLLCREAGFGRLPRAAQH